MTTAYIFLGFSILSEVIASSFLTATKGFTVLKPSIICFFGYLISYLIFGYTLLNIDLGIAYATWGAAGMIVTTIVGYIFYKQKLTKAGYAALILIIVCTVTINLFG